MNFKTGLMALSIATAPLSAKAQGIERHIVGQRSVVTHNINNKLSIDAMHASSIDAFGGVATGTFEKGKNSLTAQGGVFNGSNNIGVMGKLRYAYKAIKTKFLGSDLTISPEAGLDARYRSLKNDRSGMVAAEGGVRTAFSKPIHKNVKLDVEVGGGAALPFEYDNGLNKGGFKKVVVEPYGDAKLGISGFGIKKNSGVQVSGGKDTNFGNFISVGFNQKF